jgi:hypothetical protein
MHKEQRKAFTLGFSLAVGLLGVYALAVTIPHIFSDGQVISAAQMNANFAALDTAVDNLEAKFPVNTPNIANNAVTGTQIADNAIQTDEIENGTIINEDLADNAVNSVKIVDNSVTGNDIAAFAVGNQELGPNAADKTKILDEPGVVQDVDYLDLTLTQRYWDNPHQLESVTLTAPTSGYALVMGSASLSVIHANGTDDSAVVGISNVGTGSFPLPDDQRKYVVLSSNAPSGSYSIPVASQKIFPVNAGSNTFYLLAGKQFSSDGGFKVNAVSLSVVFFPTSYGAVSANSVQRAPAEPAQRR